MTLSELHSRIRDGMQCGGSTELTEEICSGMVLCRLITGNGAKSILKSESVYLSVVEIFLNCSVYINTI